MLAKIAIGLCVLTAVAHAVLFKYPMDSPNPSIMLDAEFVITVKAFQHGKEVKSFTKDTSNADEVTIQAYSAQRSFMYLRFKSGVNWAFVFTENSPTDITMRPSVQFTPTHLFGKITTMDTSVQFDESKTVNMPPAGKSFDCTHKTQKNYIPVNLIPGDTNFTVTVTVERFKVQAYGVKDGKFGPAVHCAGDAGFTTRSTTTPTTTTTTPTTTTTTTTPTTTTTTTPGTTTSTASTSTPTSTTTTTMTTTTTKAPFVPPPATTNTYVVKKDNVSCIVMVGKMNIDVTYEARVEGHAKNLTLKLGIPADATADGDCTSSSHQRISIHFFGNWILDIIFKLHVSSLNAIEARDPKDIDYSVHNMSLTYYIDDLKFPHAVQPEGTKLTASDTNEKELPEKTKGQSYYECDSGSYYQLEDSAKVKTSDVKFKAFNDDDDSSFKGKPMRCDADKHSHSHCNWPLIIGCIFGALFLLLLIILVIYLIVKWRVNSSYHAI